MTDSSRTAFDELMAEVMRDASRFGHREHVKLTWLAIGRFGIARAGELIADGLHRTARYAGAPQKFNATMTRAWVEAIGHHLGDSGHQDFDDFLADNPGLLDKRLLRSHYSSGTLASRAAREGWVPPDLLPFPWP